MELHISCYRSLGLRCYIVNERFEAIDEVREAKELFEKLSDTLSVSDSWDYMFSYTNQHCEVHGNADVPYDHRAENGYNVRVWIDKQKQKKAKLTNEQVLMLNSIGIYFLFLIRNCKNNISLIC